MAEAESLGPPAVGHWLQRVGAQAHSLPCSPWGLSSPPVTDRPGRCLPQLQKPGRLPDTALPTLQNGAAVTDLAWDPFDPCRLAVGKEAGC